MIKPLDLLVESVTIGMIGLWNFAVFTIIPIFTVQNIISEITQFVTLASTIVLLVYMFFRARKMYWDSEISKNKAKNPKLED